MRLAGFPKIVVLFFFSFPGLSQVGNLDSLKQASERFGTSRSQEALQAKLNYAIRLARKDAIASDSLISQLESFPEAKKLPEFWARVLSMKADLKEEAGDRLGATALYQQVYHLGDSLNSDDLRKLALTGLGSVEIPKGDLQRGIGHCRRAIEISMKTKSPDPHTLAKLYYNIGLAHAYQNTIDSSERNLNIALRFASQANANNLLGICHAGLAMVWIKKGNLYRGLEQSKMAISYLEKVKDNRQIIGSLNTVGLCYFNLGNHKMAEKYFRESVRLSKMTNSATSRIQLLSNLGLALEKQKKWEEAYWILDEAFTLKDTLFDEQTEKHKLSLEAKFENKLKEKDIELLKKDKEKQALEIQRQRLFNWGLGGLGLMAMALAFVFYRNAQLRKKTNELLRMEKYLEQRIRHKLEGENKKLLEENLRSQFEMLKSQVNPHFLFNSLNSLSSLIRLDADRAEQFVEELSSVYRYLLKSNESQLNSLREELDFIQSYVHLLKTRFGDALRFETSISSEDENRQIPPLTLQLLVENTIKHNIVSHNQPLTIKIVSAENHFLIVENNLQRKTSGVISHKVGLSNIASKFEILGIRGLEVGEDEAKFWVMVPLV
jgi:tetratricopeptide (TPR) repeat protein